MSEAFDVLIIGAGIQGASLAFHLSKRDITCLVIEKYFLASGATGKSSGLVRMHYDSKLESQLAWESFRYFLNWKELVGGECGFTRTGFLELFGRDYEKQLLANISMHQEIGIPAFVADAGDVKRLAPSFYTEDLNLASYEPESGYADPTAAAASLMDAARRNGTVFRQGVQVTGIQVKSGRVAGVKTSQGSINGGIVVNAAGAWAAQVAAMVGLSIPVDTWRHDTMFIRRPQEMGPSHPTVIDFIRSMYFRPETGDLTLVGLEDGNPIGEDPDGDVDIVRPGFVDRASDRICERIPVMEQGSLHSASGGFDGITPDQAPILDQAGPDGFYLACGFSGTGFKIAPAVGACMAELILDGRSRTVDISPFNLKRFEKGNFFSGENAYQKLWR
ncbi:NAD(P)/FAD-dependent oxidoreductase [Chloroflexota bacterium]